jgi:TPP-dependent pyruvate/acetoin dehydrogenase alpha subunit
MAKTGKLPTSIPQTADGKNEQFSLIPNQKLLAIYALMLKSRLLAERQSSQGNELDFEQTLGHEASVAGVAIDLNPEDIVLTAQGSLLPAFIKGVPLDSIFPSVRPLDLPAWHVLVGSAETADLLHRATRVALDGKVRSIDQIVAVFCHPHAHPDAHNDESWQETMTFAAEMNLPILFVSLEATGSDRTVGANGHIKDKAFGVPAISVDGNDAVAVYRVASESISRARLGRGPTLIDCRCFGLAGSTGEKPADFTEADAAAKDDPIVNLERYLSRKGLFSAAYKLAVSSAFTAELDAAVVTRRAASTSNGANSAKRIKRA